MSAQVRPPASAPDRPLRSASRTSALEVRVRRVGPDALALLFLAVCALVLHRDGLLGGPAFYESDTRLFYYPLTHWVGEQLHAGQYPLWLPGIFTGYPVFADGEMGLLYLPQVALLFALPSSIGMVWLRVLHVFLAGAFTYAFLRTLRLGPLASLGGGLVFAFGSFTTAQMHHENVIRSAVWLPLVLALAERALRASGRRGLAWTALAALAFALSALGLHVQPVMMLALALGAYVVFRSVAGWPAELDRPTPGLLRRSQVLRSPLVVLLGVLLGGIAVAGAQWLSLAEWALVSFRRGGVDYEFASAFGLALENLPTLLFPYFFRLADGATWWTLWQPWETHLYVGIPSLALSLVGLGFSRRREALFFLVLGLLSLWVAMGHYAPVFNLHQLLWSIPGFSFLRAPGRFVYLVVFALAGLTGLGLQAMLDRRAWLNRLGIAMLGGIPAVGTLAAILALFPSWRSSLLADPDTGRAWAQSTYLAIRAQYVMSADLVYRGLLDSLDLANPKTAWSVGLLALTVLGFVAWLGLGVRRPALGQAAFVALLAADLLVFAADFHPRAPLHSLAPAWPPGVDPDARFLQHGARSLADVEPNQLLGIDLSTVEGYSSLPSQRHVDLYAQSQRDPSLLTVWSAGYLIEPKAPVDGREAAGIRLRADHPVAAGYAGTGSTSFDVPQPQSTVRAVRLVGTLSYAFEVPQGKTVAEVHVHDRAGNETVLPIRAGVELAERAIDRPSLQPYLRHRKPTGPTAYDYRETSPEGEEYLAHLYLAELPLPAEADVARVALRPMDDHALVQIFGIGLVQPDGSVQTLGFENRQGSQLVSETESYRVLLDTTALPRAYVRDRANVVYRWTRPDETPVQIMDSAGFDPRVQLLIEGDQVPTEGPVRAQDQAASVEDLGPNALRISATATRPSYLVVDDFYHRGWKAWVDGREVPVSIANAVFRAVPLEPGSHVVEMRFEPLSHEVGALVSVATLLLALGLVLRGFRSGD